MSKQDANLLSATAIVSAIGSGALRCEDVARACLDRIEAREGAVKAWAFLDPDAVIRQARDLDRRPQRGPLHGVPVGVKDVMDTFDMPTEMGSPIYRGNRSIADASCVGELRAAGALMLGKTHTCEFAGVAPPVTANPHDPAHTPGGSSSGSAAAVADFMVPLALGTQTAGSVLRPSSFCGVVGYKPSFGLISTEGVKSAAQSLDTVGLLCRAVEDAELWIRVLTNAAPVKWLSPDARVRIGLCRTHAWDTAQDAARSAIEDAAKRLAAAGASVREVKLPAHFAELEPARVTINDYERARGYGHEWRAGRDQLSEGLAKMIQHGVSISQEDYVAALARAASCRNELDALFADVDVLLTPTAPGEAPVGLGATGDHRFQSMWTVLRTPSISLPTSKGPKGLPIGIQLVARPYADATLLTVARLAFDVLGRGPAIAV